jgi:hypothetical protein
MAGARLFAKVRSERVLDAEFKRLVARLCEVTNQPVDQPAHRLLSNDRAHGARPNGRITGRTTPGASGAR